MFRSLLSSPSSSLVTLAVLTLLYFFENFDRYLIAVSPIPYIDYTSYEYSLLAGPAFTIVYTVGGLLFALYYSHRDERASAEAAAAVGTDSSRWKLSKLNVLSLCSGIFSLAFAATAFGVTFWQQVIVRIVMGLTQSVITPFSTSIIKDLFPPSACGSAFGIFNSGTYFAFSFSLSLGTFLYHQYGWQAGYLLFGIIGMGISLLIPFLRCFISQHDSTHAANASHQAGLDPSDPSSTGEYNGSDRLDEGHLRVDITEEGSSEFVSPRFRASDSDSSSSTITAHAGSIHSQTQRVFVSPMATHRAASADLDLSTHNPLLPTSAPSRALPRGRESLFQNMKHSLREIFFRHWWRTPGVLLVCLATGIRLGGGYIWSGYTGVFFSELFVVDSDSDTCQYSFNSTQPSVTGMCSEDYPYCRSGDCSALADYPWHNQGMDAIKIETFMSWVPIVGSALGSMVGGFLSDSILQRFSASQSTLRTLSIRALISGISNLVALPLIVWSFFLPYPGCFLIYIGSGMVGEVYFSQALAMMSDARIIPRELTTSSVALFMLIVTIIGGNSPLLVPALMPVVGFDQQVLIDFTAASADTVAADPVDVTYSVWNSNAKKLQYSLVCALGGCYALSGIVYLLAFVIMQRSKR